MSSFLDVRDMKVEIGDSQSKFVFGRAMIGAIIGQRNILDIQVTEAKRDAQRSLIKLVLLS